MSGLHEKLQELYDSGDDDDKAVLLLAAAALRAYEPDDTEVQGFQGINALKTVSAAQASSASDDALEAAQLRSFEASNINYAIRVFNFRV